MMRIAAPLVVVALVVGCQGGSSITPVDPFGRTTVEPPRTGAVGMQANKSPVYVGAHQATVPNVPPPPSTPGATPAATPSAPKSGYEPPGGSFDFKGSAKEAPRPVAATRPGDRISIPVASRDLSARPEPAFAGTSRSSSESAVEFASSESGTSVANRERIVRPIEPAPNEPVQGVSVPQYEPDRIAPPEGVINIMELPPAGAGNDRPRAAGSDGVRFASATLPIEDGPKRDDFAASAGPTVPRTRYSHDPNYGWLRGRLEYSQIDRRWKLRYIPIDGETDDFGGSVVIADTAALSGYERGDFVEIHGSLAARSGDDCNFAPEFRVDRIQPVAG